MCGRGQAPTSLAKEALLTLAQEWGAQSPLLAEWVSSMKPWPKTLLEFMPFSTTDIPSTPRVAGAAKGWAFVLIQL